jgi:hypothetical protein
MKNIYATARRALFVYFSDTPFAHVLAKCAGLIPTGDSKMLRRKRMSSDMACVAVGARD